jgi:hypothetical protein
MAYLALTRLMVSGSASFGVTATTAASMISWIFVSASSMF